MFSLHKAMYVVLMTTYIVIKLPEAPPTFHISSNPLVLHKNKISSPRPLPSLTYSNGTALSTKQHKKDFV